MTTYHEKLTVLGFCSCSGFFLFLVPCATSHPSLSPSVWLPVFCSQLNLTTICVSLSPLCPFAVFLIAWPITISFTQGETSGAATEANTEAAKNRVALCTTYGWLQKCVFLISSSFFFFFLKRPIFIPLKIFFSSLEQKWLWHLWAVVLLVPFWSIFNGLSD